MDADTKSLSVGLMIVGIVILATGIGVLALLLTDPSGEQGSGLAEEFDYDLEAYQEIDPALICYDQTGQIALDVQHAKALAVGPDDKIYVAGNRAVQVLSPDGATLSEISLDAEPTCVAVGHNPHARPGDVYVGLRDHIEVFDSDGQRVASWPSHGPKAQLTSIALAEEDVFVADAGGRVVVRCDLDGNRIAEIGQKDERRNIPGFSIPSPYFDVAMAPDGLLRVVNPGKHLIEAYTFDGDRELAWGKRSIGVEGFCGCCNPCNIALLPDGQVVTAEKGIPRVKLYTAGGEFVGVVAAPNALISNASTTEETRTQHKLLAVDVATDSRERVLVLDPVAAVIRVFEAKPPKT